MAFVKAPGIVRAIEEIVLMGGAYFEVGNITPAAEFNIYVDHEAASIALACGAPITMMPLDVTPQVLGTPERLGRIEAVGTRCAHAAVETLRFSETFDRKNYGWDGAPLHDPNVIASLIDLTIYTGRTTNVTVETASPLTRGTTMADYWPVTDRPANVRLIRGADADRFDALPITRLARLP